MISVQEVINDPDMIVPSPFTVLRSTGQWVAGGFQSVVTQQLQTFGPVRVATDQEVNMLPEADRVGQTRAFYATFPILLTRGAAPVPGTYSETPTGSGTVYQVAQQPPVGGGILTLNGQFLTPGIDYWLNGLTLTFAAAPVGQLTFSYPQIVRAQAAESDVIQWAGESYRVLAVYRTEGSGYVKALGTRLAAS